MRLYFLLITVSSYKFNWYYNNNVHNFGNIGLGGKFHAFCAHRASRTIDMIAYNNENVRLKSLKKLENIIPNNNNIDILDIGCGVGISTENILSVFPSANIIGIDCSVNMLNNCKTNNKITYIKDFAHKSKFANSSFDLINSMFLFHEVPREGRIQLLEECSRLLRPGGYLNIMDIRLNYKHNYFMLSGEPFLLDYLNYFEQDIKCSYFEEININTNTDDETKNRLDRLFVKPPYNMDM